MPTPPDQINTFIADLRADPEYSRNLEKKTLIDAMARELEEAHGDDDTIFRILNSVRERMKSLNGGKIPTNPAGNPAAKPQKNTPKNPLKDINSSDILLSLSSRYTECLQTFSYYHIPQKIKGIDNQEYKVPTLNQIEQKLSSQPEKLALIKKLKNPKMLLRPIAISTKTLQEKLHKEKDNPLKKTDPYNGVNIWNELKKDKKGDIVYNPTNYTAPETKPDGTKIRNDGGKTKLELLHNNETSFPGWDVVFIDGDIEVPKESTSKDAHTLLKKFTEAGYSGMTVDDALLLQMDGISKGTPYNQAKWEFLLGNYVPGSAGVPGSGWDPDGFQVCVSGPYLGPSSPALGARRLVRI